MIKACELKEGDTIKLAGLDWIFYARDRYNDCIYVITQKPVAKCVLSKNKEFERVVFKDWFNPKEIYQKLDKELPEGDGVPGRLPYNVSEFTGMLSIGKGSISFFMYNDTDDASEDLSAFSLVIEEEYFEPNCTDYCKSAGRDCTEHKAVVLLKPGTLVNKME